MGEADVKEMGETPGLEHWLRDAADEPVRLSGLQREALKEIPEYRRTVKCKFCREALYVPDFITDQQLCLIRGKVICPRCAAERAKPLRAGKAPAPRFCKGCRTILNLTAKQMRSHARQCVGGYVSEASRASS